jgi:hypothetical protein
MKVRIKRNIIILSIIIVVFFILLIANKEYEHEKKFNNRIVLDLKNGWVTLSNKKLPKDYSPKKYIMRLTEIEDSIVSNKVEFEKFRNDNGVYMKSMSFKESK